MNRKVLEKYWFKRTRNTELWNDAYPLLRFRTNRSERRAGERYCDGSSVDHDAGDEDMVEKGDEYD